MKRSLWILRVILVGALVSSGCGSGPTSPGNPSNPAQPGNPGQPGSLNLSGTWTGSIQYYVGSCSTETVSVALTQADTAGANGFCLHGTLRNPVRGASSDQRRPERSPLRDPHRRERQRADHGNRNRHRHPRSGHSRATAMETAEVWRRSSAISLHRN